MVIERAAVVVLALAGALSVGCAPKNEAMPNIVVAPGLKERLVLMDRFHHANDGRPHIPHVTVEEVDEAELEGLPPPAGSAETTAATTSPSAPQVESGPPPAR